MESSLLVPQREQYGWKVNLWNLVPGAPIGSYHLLNQIPRQWQTSWWGGRPVWVVVTTGEQENPQPGYTVLYLPWWYPTWCLRKRRWLTMPWTHLKSWFYQPAIQRAHGY